MPARTVAAPAAIALGVFLYTIDPLYRLRMRLPYSDPIHRDPAVLVVYAVIGAAGIAVLMTGHRWRRLPAPMLLTACAFAAWYVLSATWSVDSGETLRHSVFIVGALAAGCAATRLVPLRTLGWAIWGGLHISLLWSFAGVATSREGALDHRGDATGVFFNRNSLALYAALAVLVGGMLLVDLLRRAPGAGGDAATATNATTGMARGTLVLRVAALTLAAAMDVVLLRRTASATPVVALGCAAATVVLVVVARAWLSRVTVRRSVRARERIEGRLVLGGGVAMIAVAGTVWVFRDRLFDRLGRGSDLTGRSGIWDASLDWVGDRPLHGLGYLGPWADMTYAIEARDAAGLSLPVTSAHNSFVEALLGGGAVGFVAFCAFVAVVYVLTARAALAERTVLALLPFAIFMFILVENMTETLVVGNHLTVALLGAAGAAAAGGATRPSTARDGSPSPGRPAVVVPGE